MKNDPLDESRRAMKQAVNWQARAEFHASLRESMEALRECAYGLSYALQAEGDLQDEMWLDAITKLGPYHATHGHELIQARTPGAREEAHAKVVDTIELLEMEILGRPGDFPHSA